MCNSCGHCVNFECIWKLEWAYEAKTSLVPHSQAVSNYTAMSNTAAGQATDLRNMQRQLSLLSGWDAAEYF